MYAQQRIIGGQAIDISQAPYQVAVFAGNSFGGGVIINDQWILTAKHVVYGVSPSSITIAMGYTNPKDDPERSRVDQVICHGSGDIALLKLSEPIVFSKTQKPINISSKKFYEKNTSGTVTGWGRTSIDGSSPVSQLYRCSAIIESCSDQEIKAKPSQSTPFRGDSGGPLTSNMDNTLIGLVSHGDYETPTTTSTYYTNVGAYYNWINQYVDLYSLSGPKLVCSTATFNYSAPGNCDITASSNVEIISKDQSTLVIQAKSRGSSYVTIEVEETIILNYFFWAKEPAITGVTSNGSYLTAETAGFDAGITYSEWWIAGNKFTTYSGTLSCPYSSGTYNVSVTARNDCGTSITYNGQVTISNNKMRYEVSVLSGTKQVKVSLAKENTEGVNLVPQKETMLDYQLINATSGVIAANGSISGNGGLLNFSHVASGIYVLRLEVGNGAEETFKFMLK